MGTRTRLTMPPGSEPEPELRRAVARERYSPGLAIPDEPREAGRHRRLVVALAVVALLGVLGSVWFQIATRNQDQDPSLAPPVDAPEPRVDEDPAADASS